MKNLWLTPLFAETTALGGGLALCSAALWGARGSINPMRDACGEWGLETQRGFVSAWGKGSPNRCASFLPAGNDGLTGGRGGGGEGGELPKEGRGGFGLHCGWFGLV